MEQRNTEQNQIISGLSPRRDTASDGRTKSPARKPRGGRPTKQATEELNRRILDVAAALFASQGFAATSMEQIAAACKAGKDTIYRRYSSKTALFSALVEQARSEVIRDLDTATGTNGTCMEKLRRYARAMLEVNMRPELIALNRVALSEAVAFGGVEHTPTAKDPIMTRFAELVKEAQTEGSLIEGDDLFIADQLLYATAIKPLVSAFLGQDQFADKAAQDRYFDRAWRLFLKGASPMK